MTMNKKSDWSPVISAVVLNAVLQKQFLQCGKIWGDKQTVFITNSLLVIIIYMDKWSSFNIKHITVLRAGNRFL